MKIIPLRTSQSNASLILSRAGLCKPRALLDEEHTSLPRANRSPSILHNHQHCSMHRSWARRSGQQERQTQGSKKLTRMLVYRTTAKRRNSCTDSFSQLMKGMSVKRQCSIKRDRSQTDIRALAEKANNIATTRARRSQHCLYLIDQDHANVVLEMRFSRPNVRRASGASPQK